MDGLRHPFLFLALALMVIVIMVEVGAAATLGSSAKSLDIPVPGFGIPYLALVDTLVLFTTLLFCSPFLISHRLQGRIQGCITLLLSIGMLLLTITLIFSAFTSLTLMATLLISPIFGTFAYFAIYGDFDVEAAAIILSLSMFLKIGFAGCLIAAQQRFLQNTGLVLIVLTSLINTLIVTFLHNLVPGMLASITDAIAAIIIAIIALIWLIVFCLGSLISIVKAIS
jgi:hypothetical protein